MQWIVAMLVVAAQASPLPPAYPRAGATKLLENARVQVWDIVWLKQRYPLHQHLYDLIGVYYASGDRTIISPEGERQHMSTKAWETAFRVRGLIHIEEGASDAPLRAVFVEMKEPAALGPSSYVPTTGAPAFPVGDAKQLRDNDRAIAWELIPAPTAASPTHRHVRDAVVVSFADMTPRVTWVQRGTEHRAEDADRADRVYVFELK
jgi:hypothetical protein